MNDFTHYASSAEEAEAAYNAYCRFYAQTYPQPKPPQSRYARASWRDYLNVKNSLFSIMVFFCMMSSSVMLSAFRTGPVFAALSEASVGRTLAWSEAVLAVIMVELSIASLPFVREYLIGKPKRPNKGLLWMWLILIVLAIGTNAYAVLFQGRSPHPEIELLISLAVGSSAPIIGGLSGHVLALLVLYDKFALAEAQLRYEENLRRWEAALAAAWQQDRDGFITKMNNRHRRAQVRVEPVLLPRTQVQRLDEGQPVTRGKSQNIVFDYLDAHPEQVTSSLRKLAAEIGVNKDTVKVYREQWLKHHQRSE
jgi:hypothetical protein